MKKILTLTITIALFMVMALGLTGCGGDASTSGEPASAPAASLVDVTTDQGISLKLPSDMKLLDNVAVPTYASSDQTEICNVTVTAADGTPISSLIEEDLVAGYQTKYKNVAPVSFQNDAKINGKDAAIIQVTLTTPAGADIVMTQVFVTDDTNYYVVNFMYPTANTDCALAKNIQACIDSITIK